ncbi:MAG: hypothetical protein ACD_3C00100G0012 [uncultured bacterium (gcode 4)]|uniref:Activator of Hsp90 ATPase homologue 1/2-like C-terminal domain-containing protein n=1 Tax=uncultured bacterium (gcode 4) TaxID=1234023 RepID=K2G1M4_9BACT|nr:MAG: hypothetical protein ACD_3C00100G0012 [uncultured bacterium (gcode 4)]
METTENRIGTEITVETTIDEPIEKVWEAWTNPEHVVHWNNASPDWHTPMAKNNLAEGGKFLYRMEALDWSESFDFNGIYDEIRPNKLISSILEDWRRVKVVFENSNGKIKIKETFDAEDENPIELQRDWWQAILDNFKKYTESLK